MSRAIFHFGPYSAKYLGNYDGDTVTVSFAKFLDESHVVRVRLHGVDTPERYADDPREAELADQARERVRNICRHSNTLQVIVYRWDAWARRVLGMIYADGRELGELLLSEGLARPYFGGHREKWFDDDSGN